MGKIECDCGKILYRKENGVYYFWCKSCKKEIPFVIVDANGKPVKADLKQIHTAKDK